jgi:hypothetical protein
MGRFQDYEHHVGTQVYADYNRFELDTAADLVERMGSRPFVLFMNVGGVDSAARNWGPLDTSRPFRRWTLLWADWLRPVRRNSDVLAVTRTTACHSPCQEIKRAHVSGKNSTRLEPLVVGGPGVDNLGLDGMWSQVNIAPTILELLAFTDNISKSTTGISLKKSYHLSVLRRKRRSCNLQWRGFSGKRPCKEILFIGLPRGIYTIRSSSSPLYISLNGYRTLKNLAEESQPSRPSEWLPQDL